MFAFDATLKIGEETQESRYRLKVAPISANAAFTYESVKSCGSAQEIAKNFSAAGISPKIAGEYAEKAFAIAHGRDFAAGKRSEAVKKESVEALVSEMRAEQRNEPQQRPERISFKLADKFSEDTNYQSLLVRHFSAEERDEISKAKSPEEAIRKIREFSGKRHLSLHAELQITAAFRKVQGRKESESAAKQPTRTRIRQEAPESPVQSEAREEAIQFLASEGMQRAKEILDSLDGKKPERGEGAKEEPKEDAPKSVIRAIKEMREGGYSNDEIMEMARAQQKAIEKGARKK